MLVKVDKVDLKRYLGLWNQVAAFPAWFQQGCKDVTARYTSTPTHVAVLNTCIYKSGIKTTAMAKATPSGKNSLKVSFFPLTNADYIVEFVDTKYRYAVVGSSGKRYLWILSRTKTISKEVYDFLVNIAEKKGYDVSRLVKS